MIAKLKHLCLSQIKNPYWLLFTSWLSVLAALLGRHFGEVFPAYTVGWNYLGSLLSVCYLMYAVGWLAGSHNERSGK